MWTSQSWYVKSLTTRILKLAALTGPYRLYRAPSAQLTASRNCFAVPLRTWFAMPCALHPRAQRWRFRYEGKTVLAIISRLSQFGIVAMAFPRKRLKRSFVRSIAQKMLATGNLVAVLVWVLLLLNAPCASMAER